MTLHRILIVCVKLTAPLPQQSRQDRHDPGTAESYNCSEGGDCMHAATLLQMLNQILNGVI